MSSPKPLTINFRNVQPKKLIQAQIDGNEWLSYLSVTKQLQHQSQSRLSAAIKSIEYLNILLNGYSEKFSFVYLQEKSMNNDEFKGAYDFAKANSKLVKK